jgi:hypothetical protein
MERFKVVKVSRVVSIAYVEAESWELAEDMAHYHSDSMEWNVDNEDESIEAISITDEQ